MGRLPFTTDQQRAVDTTGASVVVSAGAGAGKTAVLAERCAYLVCDAPADERCDVDQLLVLTFTEAAAAEMRSRIIESIRARLRDKPIDSRLQQQLRMAETAQVSTIHAYCLWIVRRWFNELGIDPTASLMDADEATLLQRECITQVFETLYDRGEVEAKPLGQIIPPNGTEVAARTTANANPCDAQDLNDSEKDSSNDHIRHESFRAGFADLVEHYGLGDDRDIADFVLKIHAFTTSLPQPENWLESAVHSVADQPETCVAPLLDLLEKEIALQIEFCDEAIQSIRGGNAIGYFYADQIAQYTADLEEWRRLISLQVGKANEGQSSSADSDDQAKSEGTLAALDVIRTQLTEYAFPHGRAPRLAQDADDTTKAARANAQDIFKEVREKLFKGRLRIPISLFSVDEWIKGLKETAPYVQTIIDLVNEFARVYQAKKRELDQLDFSDLERFAFELLAHDNNPTQPSAIALKLQERFAYLLVDEFQDINPIQLAIIQLSSRELDPLKPNNLFAVGDVKQSIYRFRLAEPNIFQSRWKQALDGEVGFVSVPLQKNFRSRREVIDAVNLVFSELMNASTDSIAYDEHAQLILGRTNEVSNERHPVELHLLEKRWTKSGDPDDQPEPGLSEINHPKRWSAIEREAYLIGTRIQELLENQEILPEGEPLGFRHIAVLLRAARVNSERIASILSAMGIPAFADVGGSLFEVLEIRDAIAALKVLDNPQQDIPLAGVLRSGIFGITLTVDELAEMRCLDRGIPFHACVRKYVNAGCDEELRGKLETFFRRVHRLRQSARQRPLAEVIWQLYNEFDYITYVCGLPNGLQRQANLIKLHEIARKFGSFRKQGLHRFIRFVDSLAQENQKISVAPTIGEGEDVVRIMSTHQSKGLEFPVVFLAGMGSRFNLTDTKGRLLFERNTKIGMRVIDSAQMLEYPSAAHYLASRETDRATRDEEARILYVAMTRARDKLILVGSYPDLENLRQQFKGSSVSHKPSKLALLRTQTPLGWLIPILSSAPAGKVQGLGTSIAEQPTFVAKLHGFDEIESWRIDTRQPDDDGQLKEIIANGGPLPPSEPGVDDDQEVERILNRLDTPYPWLSSAVMRSAVGASAAKSTQDFDAMEEFGGIPERETVPFELPNSAGTSTSQEQAARRGILTHRILQHLDFSKTSDAATLESELQEMTSEGIILPEERSAVDEKAIAWFLQTELADQIRKAGNEYRREFQFVAMERPEFFDKTAVASNDDKVLVRGIVDGILIAENELIIVDFKTDKIQRGDVAARADHYRSQMTLYARAMQRIWRRRVRSCQLVFLSPREIVDLGNLAPEIG